MPEVSRRYTPPTCTLEVTAHTSALSRWTRQPVVKSVQFLLSFEERSAPDHTPLEIRGDHTQLESLTEAVQTYIQTVLAAPLEELSLGMDASASSAQPSQEAVLAPEGVSLRPQGLLEHELRIGSLAPETPIIPLKTTQLFDLATALDAYAAELETLPLVVAPSRWQQAPPPWVRSAAAVVFLVGISSASVPLLQRLNQEPQVETALRTPSSLSERLPLTPGAPSASSPLKVPSLEPPSPLLPSVPLPDRDLTATVPPVESASAPSTLPSPPVPPPAAQSVADLPAPVVVLPPEPQLIPVAPAPVSSVPVTSEPLAPRGSQGPASSAAAERTTLLPPPSNSLATLPQVSEVRQYFVERWQAPAELDQALQYSLVVSRDGSLQAIQPLGQTAGVYLDRTPMPLLYQPFVSPLSQSTPARLRLILGADGSVQTFLEESP